MKILVYVYFSDDLDGVRKSFENYRFPDNRTKQVVELKCGDDWYVMENDYSKCFDIIYNVNAPKMHNSTYESCFKDMIKEDGIYKEFYK